MSAVPPRALLASLLLALASSALVAMPSAPAATSAPAASSAFSASSGPPAALAERAGTDPRLRRGLFVDDRMKAANAGPAFTKIGSKAQPLWITDYYQRPEDAENAVRAYVERAADAGKTPLLVIYNIPGRDCGMYSAQQQQIDAMYYRSWIDRAAAGIGRTKPMVVVEPDALPFIGNPACDRSATAKWPALLKYAVKKLRRAGAWVYLDAGHSGWRPASEMATLLERSGVAMARGFSTNVANTRATKHETAYAKAIVKALRNRKVKGVRYVMDTSRNGAGTKGPANGDVYNPLDARLGAKPKLVFKGAFDGRLWVKLPGESDGPENGGPASGEFFPTGACRLLEGRDYYYDGGSQTCRK